MIRVIAAIAGVVAAGAGPAAAQDTLIRELAGRWQILPTDGTPACDIRLTARRVGPDLWRAIPDPACATRVPESRGVTSWSLRDGDTLLLDAGGRARMTFVEDETTLSSSPDLQAPRHYLIPRIAEYTHVPRPSELVGRWTLKGRGRAPCALTLRGAPTRDIAFAKGCSGRPLPTRLNRWYVEGLKIMLVGPNDAMIALEPLGDRRYVGEPGAWELSR